MNNQNIPFANLDDEMAALQARSEEYLAKIAALRIQDPKLNEAEIRRLTRLDNECQSTIAFCFSRKMPRIK